MDLYGGSGTFTMPGDGPRFWRALKSGSEPSFDQWIHVGPYQSRLTEISHCSLSYN